MDAKISMDTETGELVVIGNGQDILTMYTIIGVEILKCVDNPKEILDQIYANLESEIVENK